MIRVAENINTPQNKGICFKLGQITDTIIILLLMLANIGNKKYI